MVLAQSTPPGHHSDSPTLTLRRLEFHPNERDAESTHLQQLSVELFLIRVNSTIPIAAVQPNLIAT